MLSDVCGWPDPFAGTAKGGGSPDARCHEHGAGEVALQRVSSFRRNVKESGRNQLIITGVYATSWLYYHRNRRIMRDIKPFMVADALADFSRDEHLMLLNMCAVWPGGDD